MLTLMTKRYISSTNLLQINTSNSLDYSSSIQPKDGKLLMNYINVLTMCLITSLLLLSACNNKSKKAVTKHKIPYIVGAQRLVFTNDDIASKMSPTLKNILKLSEGDSREIMVKIWYPTSSSQNESNRYDYGFHTAENLFPIDPASEGYQETFDLYQSVTKLSETYYDAHPIENTAFPVIIDSHGYGVAIEAYQKYYE